MNTKYVVGVFVVTTLVSMSDIGINFWNCAGIFGINNVKSVHLALFLNTKASWLMKLHTHIRHDAPCLLPWTVNDHVLLFILG